MSSRTMDVSVLVRLVDRLTAPLRGIQRQFERLSGLAKRIGVLGGAVAAISFMAPLQSATAFDQKLRDIAVTAGAFGVEAEARIRAMAASYRALALQVGLTSEQITDAAGILVAAGMDDALANTLLPTIGRVSKAASAVPVDVAKVGFALNNTLGIQSAQMEEAFGKLIVAGKLGRFEFRDMARELPELSAQMNKFGITGMQAVETIGPALQVAMFGTDSTTTAANNFKNFLTKVLSPDAIKNFGKAGVDIAAVMQSAAAQGINPIEAAVQKILKITGISQKEVKRIYDAEKSKGKSDPEAAASAMEQIKKIAGAEKLGGLFGDMQVLDFLIPMLANIEKYRKFQAEMKAGGKAVIGQDLATQMAGPATQLNIFNESVKQLGDRVGAAFATNLPMLNAFMAQMMSLIGRVDAAFPGAIDQVLSFAGAGLILVTALGLLGPVFSVIAAGAGVVATGIGVLLSPIGLVAAAIAGLAVLIYANWSQFAPFFAQIWTGLKTGAQGVVRFFRALFSGDWTGMQAGLQTLLSGAQSIGSAVLGILSQVGSLIITWLDAQLGTNIRGWPAKVGAALSEGANAIGAGLQSAFGAVGNLLATIWQTNFDRVQELFERFRAWVDGWSGGALTAAFAKIGEAFNVLATVASAAFDKIRGAWTAVVDWISSHVPQMPQMPDVTGWIKRTYGGEAPAGGAPTPPIPATDPAGNPTGGAPGPQSWAPAAQGFSPPAAATKDASVTGRIVVSAAPGTQVQSVQSDNRRVPIVPETGRVVGRV